MTHEIGRELPGGSVLLIAASPFRDDCPWVYELALDVFRGIGTDDRTSKEALNRLEHVFVATMEHPIMRDVLRGRDRFTDPELMIITMHRAIQNTRDQLLRRSNSADERVTSGWTEERLTGLREMWEDGKTASQIAEALGNVSRNAVIGKALRLGLISRPKPEGSEEG